MLFWLLLCLGLLLLSMPVRVSAQRADDWRLYVRLLFFGMIFSSEGHTVHKKQPSRRRTRRPFDRRALLLSAAKAVRYLLSRTVITVDRLHLPRGAVRSTTVLGLLLWASGTALATVDTVSERLRTAPLAITDGTRPEGRITLTFALLDLLAAAILFLYMYIKRKDRVWRKRK